MIAEEFVRLRQHSEVLRKWQMFQLGVEILLSTIRIFTQTVFAVISSLALIQPILMYFIIGKHASVQECQIYIIVAVLIIYSVAINQIDNFMNKSQQGLITEQFIMSYKNWGYWMEVVFRGVGALIVWRSYQTYQLFSYYGISQMENEHEG